MRTTRTTRTALWTLAALTLGLSSARGQDAPPAEEAAPAAAEAPAEATPEAAEATAAAAEPGEVVAVTEEVFKEGVAAFNSKDFMGAARKFHEYIAGNQPSADFYEWTEYYLARTLKELGLVHGAAEFFYNVAKTRSQPALLPDTVRALEQIVRYYPYDEELLVYDLIAGSEFGDLPDDVRAFVEYTQGLVDLRDGQDAWAGRHFDNICPTCSNRLSRIERSTEKLCETDARPAECYNKTLADKLDVEKICEPAELGDERLGQISGCYYFYRGRYAQAVDTLKRGKEMPARRIFSEVSLASLNDVDSQVANDALKALARLYFEEGARTRMDDEISRANRQELFTEALDMYERVRVPFLSHEEALIFLEKAWTRYYANDMRGAMGILISLDAPSYRDYFKPERFVLQALIYKKLCHYAAAKGAAREYRRRYGEAIDTLRQKRDPLSHPALRAAALQGPVASRRLTFLKTLQVERDLIERFGSETPIAQYLARIYDLKIKETVRALEVDLNEEAKRVADTLLDYEEQARLVDYEVALEVFKRLKAGEGSTDLPPPEEPIPVGTRDVYYTFDGEYWNDELHDYRFRIESRCFGEELFE
ncbi:MAG: hypothetical protein ABIJ09_15255 [Pseudomonadota bacterium]